MSDSIVDMLLVLGGLAVGAAITVPRFLRLRRRSLGRLYRRELTHDGATYQVRLRKGEGVWTPGLNGLAYGPATATFEREDLPEGTIYHLELLYEDGSAQRFMGPIAPRYVAGSEAEASFRKDKKWVPVVALVLLALQVLPVLLGAAAGDVASQRWGAPLWAALLIGASAYLGSSLALRRSAGAVAGLLIRRRRVPPEGPSRR